MALHTIVELRRCPYPALCKKDGCDDAASVQARYVDEQGRTLRKHEFCEPHARLLERSFEVQDMRLRVSRAGPKFEIEGKER